MDHSQVRTIKPGEPKPGCKQEKCPHPAQKRCNNKNGTMSYRSYCAKHRRANRKGV